MNWIFYSCSATRVADSVGKFWRWNGRLGVLPMLLLMTSLVAAQTPGLVWQKALGGSGKDYATATTSTTDGGFVVVGYSQSSNGDVQSNKGGSDYWVVKLNTSGDILWQKTLGGSKRDEATAITATADGGVVVVGYTESSDGDVTNHKDIFDYWVVRLNASGDIIWQKTLGGSGYDYGNAITTTTDGGFMVAGYTESSNGDVTGQKGNGDYWVVKLSASGDILWQKTLGGSNQDEAMAMTAATDGGFVVAGYSRSSSGDVQGNKGGSDYWVVKLNAGGDILWQKTLGGSDQDSAKAITTTTDGGFVVVGSSRSSDGDVTNNKGGSDYWVVKLSASGDILWQKTLGGSGYDYGNAITTTTDGGFMVAGYTESSDGDVTGQKGNGDYWVVKLSASGDILWQKTLGGPNQDRARAIMPIGNRDFLATGYTESNNGDVTGFKGGGDYWVARFNTLPTVTNLAAAPSPGCAGQPVQFTATLGNLSGPYSYTLTNGAGTEQRGTSSTTTFSQSMVVSNPGNQNFTLRIETGGGAGQLTVPLTVNPIPSITLSNNGPLSATNFPALPGSNTPTPTVLLNAQSNAPNVSFIFSDGAAQQNGGNTAKVSSSGIFSVTATANGCTAVASTTVLGANSPTACRENSATISLTAEGSPLRYEWYQSVPLGQPLKDGAYYRGTTTANLTVLRVTQSQTYYARVYYSNGSSAAYGPYRVTMDATCRGRVGVSAEAGAELHITLLGNPLEGDVLRAQVEGSTGQRLQVELLDTSGQPVRSQIFESAESTQKLEWNLSGRPGGVYLLQAISGRQRHSVKLVKP